MLNIFRKVEQPKVELQHAVKEVVVAEEKPEAVVIAFPDRPIASALKTEVSEEALTQYQAVAERIGFETMDLMIERFKLFMQKNDLPIYDLRAVVKYMDAVAKRDNSTGYGWHWLPLRKADAEVQYMAFGTASSADGWMRGFGDRSEKRPASDYFITDWYNGSSMVKIPPYSKIVPIHALERVERIEKEFGARKFVFAVTDYATEPHIRPDPFLMVIVPNPRVAEGVGRFVIDVWDEPGFGITEMVK